METEALDAFRAETRAWLEANCPVEMREPVRGDKDVCWGGRNCRFRNEAQKLWLQRMAERGWTVPGWPKEYGGGGLSKAESRILQQEMNRINARPPLSSFGIWMLGPALMKYGNEAQKQEHLPLIARGEIRWCQGYSEPGAGSDLASLRTSAVLEGDEYVVNGQKLWTSYADEADWIFCLVRTDSKVPKHQGISFLLFDMASPGVSTRPIRLISGDSPFCETFFKNVRVPVRNLVGELGKGWDIAKFLLTHERQTIGGNFGSGTGARRSMHQVAIDAVGVDSNGVLADTVLRTDIIRQRIDSLAFNLTRERLAAEARAGQGIGAMSSVIKYYGSELNKRRQELMMTIGGSDALLWKGEAAADGAQSRSWLRSRANSIEGGTAEIQLNIIAKRILQLPGA